MAIQICWSSSLITTGIELSHCENLYTHNSRFASFFSTISLYEYLFNLIFLNDSDSVTPKSIICVTSESFFSNSDSHCILGWNQIWSPIRVSTFPFIPFIGRLSWNDSFNILSPSPYSFFWFYLIKSLIKTDLLRNNLNLK